jgi:hypothetical protein
MERKKIVDKDFYLPFPGNYVKPQTLIDAILDTFLIPSGTEFPEGINITDVRSMPHATLRGYVDISFNPATRKFKIWRPDTHMDGENWIVDIALSLNLAYLLGQEESGDGMMKTNFTLIHAELHRHPLMTEHFSDALVQYTFPLPCALQDSWNLYLYTDIVHHSPLADSDAEFLYVVPLLGSPGDYMHLQVENIIYKRVNTTLIRSIHIEIKDHCGKRVKFNHGSGDFTATLHFRKIA